jgi:hypothetical protein
MAILSKRRVGGGFLLVAGSLFGKETFAWLIGKGLDFVSQGVGSVTLTAFPWQNAIATLMALVGAYFAFWPDKRPVRLSVEQRAHRLGAYAAKIVARFHAHRGPFGRVAEAKDPFSGVIQDGISLLISFEKEGFRVPNMEGLYEGERRAVCMLDYFAVIGPLLRDGHVDEARGASSQLAQNAINQASEMQLGYFR